jgi:hypothetical protein
MKIMTRTLAAVAGAAMLATVGAGAASAQYYYRGGDHGYYQGQGYWHNGHYHTDRGNHYGWRNQQQRYNYNSPSNGYYNYWNAPRGRDGRIDTKCPKYC